MKWMLSIACSGPEDPWTAFSMLLLAKHALMELGDTSLALSGSTGPIISLHSEMAFSLPRIITTEGPLHSTQKQIAWHCRLQQPSYKSHAGGCCRIDITAKSCCAVLQWSSHYGFQPKTIPPPYVVSFIPILLLKIIPFGSMTWTKKTHPDMSEH